MRIARKQVGEGERRLWKQVYMRRDGEITHLEHADGHQEERTGRREHEEDLHMMMRSQQTSK